MSAFPAQPPRGEAPRSWTPPARTLQDLGTGSAWRLYGWMDCPSHRCVGLQLGRVHEPRSSGLGAPAARAMRLARPT